MMVESVARLTFALLLTSMLSACGSAPRTAPEEVQVIVNLCSDGVRRGGEVHYRDRCGAPGNWSSLGLPRPVVQLAGMTDRYCAVTTDGELFCWGCDLASLSCDDSVWPPRRVPLARPVLRVALGVSHACVLTRSGEVWCWGYSERGQLGYTAPRPPEWVSAQNARRIDLPAERYLDIVAFGFGGCALTSDRELYCWGTPYAGPPWPVHRSLDGVQLVDARRGVCAVVGQRRALFCDPYGREGRSADTPLFLDTGRRDVEQLVVGPFPCISDAEGRVHCRQRGAWEPVGRYPGGRLVSTVTGVCVLRGPRVETCMPSSSTPTTVQPLLELAY